MSVVNTTYNFNQPNMNFGQALLYGAFGSLTGGMGCFGGGYGMGMGGFGFGGSIFPMGTMMTGYNCMAGMGCYSDQMAGAQVGNILSGVVVGGITRAIQERRTAKTEKQEKLDTAKNNVKTLDKEISELQAENKGLKPAIVNNEVTSQAKSACFEEASVYTSAKKALDIERNKKLEDYDDGIIKKLNAELSELNKKLKSTPAPTGEEKTKIEDRIKEITKTDGELAKANAKAQEAQNKAIEEKQNAVKKAEEKLNEAASEIYENNDKEIKKKEADKVEAQKVIDEIKNDEYTKNNNKNAKLEAKCDAEGEVEDQTTAQGKFNRAYEKFKQNQTQENFNILKEKYNEIQGNKESFKKLMKHIIKQHPEFDETNIDW